MSMNIITATVRAGTIAAFAVGMALSGCQTATQGETDTAAPAAGQPSAPSETATSSQTSAPEYDKDVDQNSAVTAEQAGKIATDKYGGTVKEVENDHFNGKSVWEVEIRDSNTGRIEVKVDKQTGEILEKEQD